jgi:hypothetical protein
MQDTPSQRLIAAAQELRDITDSLGRRIGLRRLNALDKLRLFKAAGPVLSQNQPWLGMAVLAASVVAIDDVPVPSPTTEAQIEGLVSRLGDAGISAIAKSLSATAERDVAAIAGN